MGVKNRQLSSKTRIWDGINRSRSQFDLHRQSEALRERRTCMGRRNVHAGRGWQEVRGSVSYVEDGTDPGQSL
jgi:hypothetical protein